MILHPDGRLEGTPAELSLYRIMIEAAKPRYPLPHETVYPPWQHQPGVSCGTGGNINGTSTGIERGG